MITSNQFRKIAVTAARRASEKKAENIFLFDLRNAPHGLSDFFLILSANSQVHLKTLRETIQETLEKIGIAPLHQDGIGSEQWSVLDYGGFIVHIFHEAVREFYSLERLYEEAKKIRWEGVRAPRVSKKNISRLKRSASGSGKKSARRISSD